MNSSSFTYTPHPIPQVIKPAIKPNTTINGRNHIFSFSSFSL